MPETANLLNSIEEPADATPVAPALPTVDLRALGTTALKGTAWSLGAYGCTMALRLVSNIVLSRLFMPEYFGLMTLLNTVLVGLTLFSDLGLTPTITRSRRGDDPAFLNTAWSIQVIRGAALWLFCLVLSQPVAEFYREPRLQLMVPVVGLSLIIASFNSTGISTLSRHMAVRELTLMELSTQAAQFVFTITWTLIDRSIWALVGGRLFSDLVRLYLSHRLIPGQRSFFQWDRQAAHELFSLGRWVFCSTALSFLTNQSDRLILGKLVSLQTLGMYGIAFALSDIPRQIILSFCGYIVVPFVSKLSHLPRHSFFALVLEHRRKVLLTAAGFLALVVISGDLLMGRIYDTRYHNATWIVPILALGLWQTILYNTTNPCLFAIGKPKNAVLGYLCSSIAILTFTPLAFGHWGLVGSVFVVAFSDLPTYLVTLYGLGRERMYPFSQDVKATLVFLAFLLLFLIVRLAAGFPFPHPLPLH